MSKNRDDSSDSHDANSRYGDELLSANWNPVIELLQALSGDTRAAATRNEARDISEEEASAFLSRIYTFGA